MDTKIRERERAAQARTSEPPAGGAIVGRRQVISAAVTAVLAGACRLRPTVEEQTPKKIRWIGHL